MMIPVAATMAAGFYILSTAAYFVFLFSQKDNLYRWGYGLLAAGFAGHTALLSLQIAALGHLPAFNLSQTLSLTAWSVAGLFILLQWRLSLNFFGIYVSPLVLSLLLTAVLLPERAAEPIADIRTWANSAWLVVHIVTVFAGDAAFALACGAGIFYLIQERAIKQKKRGFFYRRLPSLERLDSAGYACLVVGFSLLTIGLITGIVYAGMVWGKFWRWDPKEVWSGITWLVYAALLHERLVVGWRGRRAAIMAILGFFVVLFTFLGVNFLLEGHHGIFTKV
ncbi:MAG: c-type cytochrome biogenesis protein CcsB [Thermodesulfobacteriota bacterium]